MKRKRIIDPDEAYLSHPTKNVSFNTEQKKLERQWYDKLQASGFNDIEDTQRSDRPLKSWHNFKFQYVNLIQRGAREEYFYLAKELLRTYAFKNETHRIIWDLHCKGLSKRNIEASIKHLEKPYKREQIGNILCIIAREIKRR